MWIDSLQRRTAGWRSAEREKLGRRPPRYRKEEKKEGREPGMTHGARTKGTSLSMDLMTVFFYNQGRL